MKILTNLLKKFIPSLCFTIVMYIIIMKILGVQPDVISGKTFLGIVGSGTLYFIGLLMDSYLQKNKLYPYEDNKESK